MVQYFILFYFYSKKIVLKTLYPIHNVSFRMAIEVLKLSRVSQLKALLTYVTRKKRQRYTKNKLELCWNQEYNPSTMKIVHIALQRKRISTIKNACQVRDRYVNFLDF